MKRPTMYVDGNAKVGQARIFRTCEVHEDVLEKLRELLIHGATIDDIHHKQHDICEALKLMMPLEEYNTFKTLNNVDEGMPS